LLSDKSFPLSYRSFHWSICWVQPRG
jgi:hypothetical protein